MGQKVMPTGFRLGITEDWRSRWYSDKDYAKNLANDMEIRKFLDKYLAKAAVAKVEIERAGDKVKVILTTARPGVVIGKKGSEIEQLRKELAKIVGGPVNIEVIEVKRPEASTPTWLPSPSLSSSKAVSRSVAPCARLFSPLASLALWVFVSSAPAVLVALR